MNSHDFKTPEAGRVIRTLVGYDAFVPAAPPPKLDYPPDLVVLLSEAEAALSELSGLGRYLPNPDLLIAPYVKREAVASSRIEGPRQICPTCCSTKSNHGERRQGAMYLRFATTSPPSISGFAS